MSRGESIIDVCDSWKTLSDGDEKRKRYYASREFGLLKKAIRARSHGQCERCRHGMASHCHHVTYERLYAETMSDLLDLCESCHRYVHGRSDNDPMAYWKEVAQPAFETVKDGWIQCPKCRTEQDAVHIEAVRVIQRDRETVIGNNGFASQSTNDILPRRRGSDVCVQFFCECGYHFTWTISFIKGCTMFVVKHTPDSNVTDGELWRE